MKKTKEELEALLDACVQFHGHLCMGQVLGIRVSVKGMELASAPTPRDLIVAVENERCLADAVLIVTGTRIGRRTLKLYKYGKMAATFLNCATGKAYRVRVNYKGPPHPEDEAQMLAVLHLPDENVVAWKEVSFSLPEYEQPGLPKRVVECSVCGEKIFDGKDLEDTSGLICIPCMHGGYYYPM